MNRQVSNYYLFWDFFCFGNTDRCLYVCMLIYREELITRSLFQNQSTTTTRKVGEFVTDVRMQPYIREQMIHFHAWSLRPSVRHYLYFDGVNMDANTRPALSTNTTSHSRSTIYAAGSYGSSLTTDESGELFGVLHIPQGEFYVGERHVVLADNATYSELANNAVSIADQTL